MGTVLVIDDDYELYALLREYFTGSEFQLEHAVDAESGLTRLVAAPTTWDAVILDVTLPGITGSEALARLRAAPETVDLPVLMLTACDSEEDKVADLEAGADDYLIKPFSLPELAARLRTILRRSTRSFRLSAEEKIRPVCPTINRSALTVTLEGREVKLTLMEIQLLEFLLEETGKVVSRDRLYNHLFGHPPQLNERGLDMAVCRLRKKIGPTPDGGDRIQAVWGEGYVFLSGMERK